MLIGEHIHTLDEKKRVSLPAKFRSELGKRVVVTRGLDGCLSLYSESEWNVFAAKLTEMSMGQPDSRAFNRIMLSGAVLVDIDASGRVLLPEYLKEFAKLGSQVVVAGMMSRVEIWNQDLWKEYIGRLEGQTDVLAEKLSDIGMM
jgi:MraZ protein